MSYERKSIDGETDPRINWRLWPLMVLIAALTTWVLL